MEITLGVSFLIVLLLGGLSVALSLSLAGVIGLYLVGGMDLVSGILSATTLPAVSSYELSTIPMFILMANLIIVSGVGDELFDTASKWVGRVPGGLAYATSITGAAFGAISGSSTASAATLASTTIPGMIKEGYEPKLAAGVVAISGTLSMLIPPSVAIVLYAIMVDESVAKLLVAGIIPGLLVTFTISATVFVLIVLDPKRAPSGTSYSFKEKILALRNTGSFVLLFLLVTGAIYTGVATPTEASAFGATGALFLALLRGRWAQVGEAFISAARTSCMIGFIIIGAHIFVYFLTMTQATQGLITYIADTGAPRELVLLAVIIILLVLGCFMELISMLILTVPILFPLMTSLGYDPIWFGILFIVVAEVGMVTPPLGLNVFVVASYSKIPAHQVFRGTFPHVIAHLIIILLLVLFPEIVLWLPSSM
ncbi:TRAP transporter large permease [Rhodobacteraceae bacterium LMO-12]|nr:TRAP transporter large permease [Rhodobacteraceae bacterium LMO-JJ12]